MHVPPFPLRSANDPAANAVRLVPLIGTLDLDTGRLERHAVVQLLPTPAELLRRHGRPQS